MRIATDSRSPYCVWLNAPYSEAQSYAAEQLCLYLRRITGARFPLIRGGKLPEYALVVGCSEALNGLGADVSGLGSDGYLVKTVGERVVIAGETDRGTIYGVFGFLEDVLGCRFYTETIEKLPSLPTLEVAELDIRCVPALEYRETYYPGAYVGRDWAVKNRNNGSFCNVLERQGGCVRYHPFVHTFEALVPVDEYFDEHPEYFSLVDGKRVRERTQLCLTNPEVLKIAKARVLGWIEAHPEATIFSVSQNDWYNPCQCDACRAIDEAEGSHAGTLLRFVNAIAEEVARKHPQVIVDTLAYQYTRTPPQITRPLPNVCVRLCSIECCFAHPLEDCDRAPSFGNRERGESFQRDLEGWAKICNRLYVWDYVVNFHHYVMPFFNFDVLAQNVRYFVRNSVKGIFEEGATTVWGGAEWDEMRAWVLMKLLWNPELDAEALAKEFIVGCYGQSASKLIAYYDLLRDALRKTPEAHFGIYDPPRKPYLTREVVLRAQTLFDEAEALAETSEVLERVRVARLPMRYWELLTMDVGASGRDEAIDAFERDLRERAIGQITEGWPLETSIRSLREGLRYRFPE